MKCSLASIVRSLGAEFPLETCGELDVPITDIQDISENTPPLRTDVLYIISQSRLMYYRGPVARGPVLCIGQTAQNLFQVRATFPTLIAVRCGEPGKVYSALSRHLYREGQRASQMPEVSGAFLRCRSLDALVETAYTYLTNPFAIHNSDGELLAYSRQAGLKAADWRTAAFQDTLFDFHSTANADHMDKSRRDQMPVLLRPESGPPQMRMALNSRGKTLGYLTVIALFHPFGEADMQVVELLGCFITLDLLRQNSITRTSVSDPGYLKSFLESGVTDMPGVPQWLEGQRCAAGRHYYLVLINTAAHRHVPFWDVDDVLSRLDRLFPEGIATRLETGIVLLLERAEPLMKSEEFADLRGQLGAGLMLGVSMPFTDLAASGHAALRQAKSAMELGMALDPEESCYRYETYAIYAGLRAAAEHMDLQELLDPELRRLLEKDAGGETLHTLEVYLSTGGKKARAAELLFIHLNTLKYRLGQIAQKLDVDLDDPATMFSLRYALHIIRYLRAFKDQPEVRP